MGVLNVTPDSFYDGGRYSGVSAEARVAALIAEGADLIDIGGESTRPGALPIEPVEQLRRIEPALRAAVAAGSVHVSVDTTSARVADRALSLGAHVVNDVSCLADVGLARVVADHGASLVIMHSRGAMSEMRGFSDHPDDAYGDVIADVLAEWCAARDRALSAGVPASDILLDPGIGFAKNARQSLEVAVRLAELHSAGAAIVYGPSRKSFIHAVDPSTPAERLGGTIAACLAAADRGAAILRVHDVRDVRQALRVHRALTVPGAAAPTVEARV